MTFRIHALPAGLFTALPTLDEEALSAGLVRRLVADKAPGYPCRVSLEDARPGETVYLLNHVHHDAATPFRASHAIYVREGVPQAMPAAGEVPEIIRTRMISLRAFGADGMMREADVADGADIARRLEDMLADPETEEVHLHFAKQGCFAARVTRA
ncbi:MAG: DUF1203 domain-containing protein [Hyphomonas sp.]|nr:DUF1203 domain-containing protein [Hyphomonas sp.]